jgi:hypothetical protein
MEREKELQRLYDIAWNVGATGEQCRERTKTPELKVDVVLHGLERTPENVSMIYKFIASATELSASTRQELCWGILEPYLRRVWSREGVDEFKTKYPLKDQYDSNFINISDVEQRVKKSGFLNEDPGPHLVAKHCSWGVEYAIQVLKLALDGAEVSVENVQKLNLSICRYWADDLDGFNRTKLGDDSVLSASLRLVRICMMKYLNAKNIRLAYPADFGIFHELLF